MDGGQHRAERGERQARASARSRGYASRRISRQISTMEAVMKKRSIIVAMFLVLLSGCAARTGSSSLSESPVLTAQAHCERNRGTWHAYLGICEVCP